MPLPGTDKTPLRIKTAIFMTVRNEDPARAILRLRTVKGSVDATGEGGAFSYFVLSDTNDPAVAAAEEPPSRPGRRPTPIATASSTAAAADNTGFKAGNVRDFCARWGKDYTLMLPLDADSLMSGSQIVRLTRMMQAHPKIGILQSLVVGMPSASAFARIFQFGMRHGMRSYTMGQAWWVGDCGPFWGHNALVRIKPFHEQCDLPMLPGKPPLGGHVLSHDQVEATLMRRAGYEVRVLPEERGSWEENPPTMLEFARRDVRWCQGNMQYLKLLDLPGLYPMSRFQLVWAILMFIGIPAWTLMIALLPVAAWQAQEIDDFPTTLAIGLYVTFFTMYLMPKIAGLLDAMLTRGGVARYGGWLRFVPGAAIELAFSFLQGAVSTIRTSIFMVGLLFGKSVVWAGQSRDAQRLSVDDGGGASVAADAVRHRRVRRAADHRAASVLVEPAADGWLSAGHPVRRADRRSGPGSGIAETRRVRHPRGLRPARRGRRGALDDRRLRSDMAIAALVAALEGRPGLRYSARSLDVYYGDAEARRGDGRALRALPAARRPRLRHRCPCRRPHGELPPPGRARGRARAAAAVCAAQSAPSMRATTGSPWWRRRAARRPAP